MPTPKRGEVWPADLGQPPERLVVILQNEAAEVIDTTIVIPLTQHMELASLATSVPLEMGEANLTRSYVSLCPQLRSLPVTKLRRSPVGELPHEKLSEIERRVAFLVRLPLGRS